MVRRGFGQAGLLNIVPRYLPRYGIAFAVTIIFRADVEAKGSA